MKRYMAGMGILLMAMVLIVGCYSPVSPRKDGLIPVQYYDFSGLGCFPCDEKPSPG
jgi:hypothetical protein